MSNVIHLQGNFMSNKIQVIGLDAGFASTVGVVYQFDPTKREGDLVGIATKVASRVIPSRVAQGANQTGNVLGEEVRNSYAVGDLTFTVDPELRNESTQNLLQYHFSPVQCVLNQHLMQLLQINPAEQIHVVSGMPIGLYYKDNHIDNDNVQKKINTLLSTEVKPLYSGEMIRPNSIQIKAEGVGVYLDSIINDQGIMDMSAEHKRVTIIDIGGKTTDISTISRISAIDYSRTGSTDIGVLDVLAEIKKELAARGINEQYEYRLEQMLHNRTYSYRGQVMPSEEVLSILDKAIKTVAYRLNNYVASLLGDAGDVDEILIAGGGGAVFGQELVNYFGANRTKVINDPQYANANGFAKYQLFNLRRTM